MESLKTMTKSDLFMRMLMVAGLALAVGVILAGHATAKTNNPLSSVSGRLAGMASECKVGGGTVTINVTETTPGGADAGGTMSCSGGALGGMKCTETQTTSHCGQNQNRDTTPTPDTTGIHPTGAAQPVIGSAQPAAEIPVTGKVAPAT